MAVSGRRWCFFSYAMLAALIWLPPLSRAQQPSVKPLVPRINETLLAEISGRGKVLEAYVSHQGEMLWIEQYPDHTMAVLLNGKQMGGYYDSMKTPGESHDGKLWAFSTRHKSKWVMMVNGQDRTAEYEDMLSPEITSDGRFVVAARKAGKWRIVADGKETSSEFDELSHVAFDPSGQHVFCMAVRRGKWVTLLDGKEMGVEVDAVFPPQWRNGHVIVTAQMNHKWTWLIDGQPGPGFDVVGPIEFTPDGKHYAYGGSSGASGHDVTGAIVVDGKPVASYGGAHLPGGFFALKLRDGIRPLKPYTHGVGDPRIAEDGTVFYAARRGEKDVAVFANGVAGPGFEDVVSPVAITPDGKHFAYVGKQGETFIEVKDHKTGPSFPSKASLSLVPWMRITKDGSHLAYEIDRGGHSFKVGIGDMAWRRVVVDGQGPEYHALSVPDFEFSEDGKHFHYQVESGGPDHHYNWIVFDGVEGKHYDVIFYDITKFTGPQSIEYTLQQGNRFLRVTETFE